MADIAELITQHGKGGQTYPLRMAQLAQADETRQRTGDMSQLRQQKFEQQNIQMDRQKQLDEISHSSTTTKVWMDKLKAGGFQQEFLQAQDMTNQISQQTQKIELGKREMAQEESVF